jgi:hypothetical protein
MRSISFFYRPGRNTVSNIPIWDLQTMGRTIKEGQAEEAVKRLHHNPPNKGYDRPSAITNAATLPSPDRTGPSGSGPPRGVCSAQCQVKLRTDCLGDHWEFGSAIGAKLPKVSALIH